MPDDIYGIGSPDANQLASEALSDRERIARHLRKHIIDQVSGRNISGQGLGPDSDRVYRDFPSDRFFAGALAPGSESEVTDSEDDLESKMQPSAIGSTVKLSAGSSDAMLSVSLSGAVWVRVYPTYQELQHREDYVSTTESNEDASDDFLPVFTRLEFETELCSIRRGELESHIDENGPGTPLVRDVNDASGIFEELTRQAEARDDIYLVDPADNSRQTIPDSALESEAAYQEFLESVEGEPAIPNWSADIEFLPSPDLENPGENALVVDIEFTNRGKTEGDDLWKTLRDPTLFEVQLEFTTTDDLTFVPYTFDPLPEDFRYNRDLWGHGRNCTIEAPEYDARRDESRPPGVQAPADQPSTKRLRTQFLPEYRQRVYESADRNLNTGFSTFTDLNGGGLKALRAIAERMDVYESERYDEALEEYRDRDDWTEDDLADFRTDRARFRQEIQRFRRGIDALESFPDTVGRAFELMNETMDRKHEFDSWHLFQLVFIVMLVPDIASREYDEYSDTGWRGSEAVEREAESALELVDVLWFPTGGGKTEAFLGVAVWNMFFDRLRGKDFGVTTWTRFPLRLLSLQQVQRMARTITIADIVRREEGHADGIATSPSRPFSIGYLVGKRNTPNALTGYNNDNAERYDDNRDLREEAKVISKCPVCEADIELIVTDDHRLAHECQNSRFDCGWQQRETDVSETYGRAELPVHIVDNELFRYAPTILAGTIDKIAAIGYQRKMAHLLTGEISAECPIHGFASMGECTEKYGCEISGDEFNSMSSNVDPYDPAPSLMVPDELHLLKESMGSFDGHYETGVEYLQELTDAGKTKILAPTATITGYEDQVYHLYTRPAERFPSPGPFLRENFYATEKAATERYYLGIIPHGRTHINSILEIIYQFHLEIQALLKQALHDPDGFLQGEYLADTVEKRTPLESDSIVEVLEYLLQYSTSLTYLLSKKDGDRLDQSIRSQLDEYFSTDNRPPLEQKSMTGGTPFQVIQTILDRLEEPWTSSSVDDVIDRLADEVSDEVFSEEIASEVADLYVKVGGAVTEGETEKFPEIEPEAVDDALASANPEVSTGLAWVLASWPNAITATSMVSHGVDVDRFNMMVFFGMPRRTAEYIQSSSRAGRDAPGLIFNVMHPIRERDLSHYHFFKKYHEFLDRLVEPVAINRWAKNSVQRTHSGLFMGLLLNHYMYRSGRNLYFGNNAEDFIRQLEQENEGELKERVVEMIGGDAAPSEFLDQTRRLTNEATQQLRVDNNKWTSDRLPNSAMRSLRDIDEQLPIRPEYQYRDLFETLDNR